jgi:phosphatidyl-myo-inositol alpha-mannosyltransferase
MIAMANVTPRHHLALPYPLRICIVVPYDLADSGGVKHHAVHLAKVLREEGHQVTLVGPSSRESDDPNRLVIRNVVNIRSNGAANPMALLGAGPILKRFFAENTFDIIHVHEPPIPSLSYWSAWLTPGVPKVATFHAYSEAPSLGIRILQSLAAPILYPYFDHAVAVSPSAARYASRTWRRPLTIVPNGIPVRMFAPSIQEASRQGSRRILAIGRLADARKGIAPMIEAFRLLRAEDRSYTLDLIGDGPEHRGLPAVDGLRYHPRLPLSELIERYHACDLFAAPATGQESFGIVLLEAMAAGKPIVCSDIGGYRDVARPMGASFVPPGDPVALAHEIRTLLDDGSRRQRMSAFNLSYVRRFDWSVVVGEVLDAYQVAIENRRSRHALPAHGFARTREFARIADSRLGAVSVPNTLLQLAAQTQENGAAAR